MVSIKTEALRELAESLNREAVHYDHRFRVLEESMLWIKRQEFEETNEIHRVLMKQYDDLIEQKKAMLQLAEAIRRICDKYDKTEWQIILSGVIAKRVEVHVDWVKLERMRSLLATVGLDMADQ